MDVNLTNDAETSSCKSPVENLSFVEDTSYYVVSSKVDVIATSALVFALSFFGIFGNVLTLVSIKTSSRLQTKSNILVGALAVIDLIICGPFFVFFNALQILVSLSGGDSCRHHTLLAIVYPFNKMPYYAGTPTLVAIAVDRYVAVVKPLHYERIVTDRAIRLVIGGSWMYAVVMGSLYGFWLLKMDWTSCDDPNAPTLTFFIDSTEHSIFTTTVTTIYLKILAIAVRIQRQVFPSETPVANPGRLQQHAGESVRAAAAAEEEARARKRWRMELKAARMTAVLIFVYVVSTIPYFVARGMIVAGNDGRLARNMLGVGSGIACIAVAFNWVLYAIFSKDIRRAFIRRLKCSSSSSSSASSDPHHSQWH